LSVKTTGLAAIVFALGTGVAVILWVVLSQSYLFSSYDPTLVIILFIVIGSIVILCLAHQGHELGEAEFRIRRRL